MRSRHPANWLALKPTYIEQNPGKLPGHRYFYKDPRVKKERHGVRLIAELAGVSIGTVDRALHGRGGIKESTRHRILQVARQIGYSPNLAARALSVARGSVRIGVCMPKEIH